MNAVLAASECRIPTYVIGSFYSPNDHLANYLPDLQGLPGVTLHDKHVAQVGRASKQPITPETYGVHFELDDLHCYRRIYNDIVVFFDGTVYPCCSTFNRATPGIASGDAFSESLREIWERIEGSLMIRTMKRQGFGRLYDIIKEYDPELHSQLPNVDSVVGPCSLCNRIFRSPDVALRVRKIFEEYEQRIVSEVLGIVTAELGADETTELLKSFLS
jgi:hypothetical protein